MSKYKDRLKKAINTVFDEMDALSNEEFKEEMDKHKGSDLAKLLEYACVRYENEEQKCPVCKTRFIPGEEVDIIIDYHMDKDTVIITQTEETVITSEEFLEGIENAGREITEAQEEG